MAVPPQAVLFRHDRLHSLFLFAGAHVSKGVFVIFVEILFIFSGPWYDMTIIWFLHYSPFYGTAYVLSYI